MRVLLTTPYDLAVPGGVNRHAFDLLDELSRRGHDALLAGPTSHPLSKSDDRIVCLGQIWHYPFNGAVTRITLDLDIAPEVRRIVRAFRPEVVHVQEPFAPTLNSFALLFAGRARRVGTFHTFAERSLGYFWSWPWCNWVNGVLDVHVAVSPAARDFAARFHAAPYQIVAHGVRQPSPGSRREVRPPGTPARLLFVGRASEPRKGFAVLREALARWHAAQPGAFVLTVVGPDAPTAEGLPIICQGHVNEDELTRAYAAADVVVVPSLAGESFGLVALEALAHGVPVVASKIRGYADWLPASAVGALVPPGDADALAGALATLVGDPVRYVACARNTALVAARYDIRRTVARLLELYSGSESASS